MWKKNHSRGVSERVGQVTVNTTSFRLMHEKKISLRTQTKQEDRECPRLFLQGLIPVEKTCWCPLFSELVANPVLQPRKLLCNPICHQENFGSIA